MTPKFPRYALAQSSFGPLRDREALSRGEPGHGVNRVAEVVLAQVKVEGQPGQCVTCLRADRTVSRSPPERCAEGREERRLAVKHRCNVRGTKVLDQS